MSSKLLPLTPHSKTPTPPPTPRNNRTQVTKKVAPTVILKINTPLVKVGSLTGKTVKPQRSVSSTTEQRTAQRVLSPVIKKRTIPPNANNHKTTGEKIKIEKVAKQTLSSPIEPRPASPIVKNRMVAATHTAARTIPKPIEDPLLVAWSKNQQMLRQFPSSPTARDKIIRQHSTIESIPSAEENVTPIKRLSLKSICLKQEHSLPPAVAVLMQNAPVQQPPKPCSLLHSPSRERLFQARLNSEICQSAKPIFPSAFDSLPEHPFELRNDPMFHMKILDVIGEENTPLDPKDYSSLHLTPAILLKIGRWIAASSKKSFVSNESPLIISSSLKSRSTSNYSFDFSPNFNYTRFLILRDQNFSEERERAQELLYHIFRYHQIPSYMDNNKRVEVSEYHHITNLFAASHYLFVTNSRITNHINTTFAIHRFLINVKSDQEDFIQTHTIISKGLNVCFCDCTITLLIMQYLRNIFSFSNLTIPQPPLPGSVDIEPNTRCCFC